MSIPSLAELVEAEIDADWLAAVGELRRTAPVDAGEALARLKVFARAEAAMAGDRLRETAALQQLVAGPEPDPRDVGVEFEVGIALAVSPALAGRQISDATVLVGRLPETLRRLRAGRTGLWHALRLAQLPCGADQVELLSRCEHAVWAQAEGQRLTPPQLVRLAQRVMTSVGPELMRDQHSRARRNADVTMRPELGTGMAWLSAYLPLLDAAMVMTALDVAADAAVKAGDERSVGMLRAATLRALAESSLTGHGYAPTPAGPAGPPGLAGPGARSGGAVQARRRRRRPSRHGRPAEVHVAVGLDTLVGLSELPGEIPGFGPVPAAAIRELARDAAIRLLVHDPKTGRLLDYGRTTYRTPVPLAATVAATWGTSAGPGSVTAAITCDMDHDKAWDNGGETTPDNLVPLDRHTHRAKTRHQLHYQRDPDTATLTWTTPLGQTTTTEPFDYRLGEWDP